MNEIFNDIKTKTKNTESPISFVANARPSIPQEFLEGLKNTDCTISSEGSITNVALHVDSWVVV